MTKELSVRAHYLELVKPYAGWAALALFVVGLFVGLIATHVAFPLLLLAAAIALAAFRYWDEIKIFDFWALDEWVRTRREAIGVRHWHAPHHAAEHFCNPAVVRSRNEAAAEMNTIMMEIIRAPERVARSRAGIDLSNPAELGRSESGGAVSHERYDAAQAKYNQCSTVLSRELHEQLTRGDLLAKGLLMRDDVALSERVIPVSRWRVMALDIAKGNASGAGWHYTGILVGKRPVIAQPVKAPAPQPRPKNK